MIAAEAFDPMLSRLRQAEDLSPDSTPRRTSSHESDERWADIAIDNTCTYEVQPAKQQMKASKDGLEIQQYVDEVETSYNNAVATGDLNSAGSRFHDSGRCKPCAFFHTKGCQSGASCLFCHRCPAHEKQRRKRLRRQLCHSLLSSFDTRGCRTQGEIRPTHPTKAGHSRMISTDSASTCSGWGNPESICAHSRQTSTSSQATSVYESGDVSNMPNIGYAPSYPNAQPQMMPHGSWAMMQPVMRPCDESWRESGRNNDLDALPVLEAQALTRSGASEIEESFRGAGDALSSMPQLPAGNLTSLACKEPPPPPPGVPTVPSMAQTHPAALPNIPVASSNHRSEHIAPAPLALPVGVANSHYEQQPQPLQCPNMPGSPVGYMTCGTYQYALVPVPMQQYNNGMNNGMNVVYTDNSQANQQQQQWGPYEEHQQQSGCMVSPTYNPEQRWAGQYELPVAAPVSPCDMGSAGGSVPWW